MLRNESLVGPKEFIHDWPFEEKSFHWELGREYICGSTEIKPIIGL
jgi:hypothetical protein